MVLSFFVSRVVKVLYKLLPAHACGGGHPSEWGPIFDFSLARVVNRPVIPYVHPLRPCPDLRHDKPCTMCAK